MLEERPRYDAVILDVMLPGKDGFAVVKELRSAGHFVPVLMLTARGRPTCCRVSRPAPMITCPNRSSCKSCWPACAACYAGSNG